MKALAPLKQECKNILSWNQARTDQRYRLFYLY